MEMKIDRKQCKEKIWRTWHEYQCEKTAVKDGYCKIHHPDYMEAKIKKREEKWKKEEELSRNLENLRNLETTAKLCLGHKFLEQAKYFKKLAEKLEEEMEVKYD